MPTREDELATRLFTTAMAQGRAGELLTCLFEGGSATIDPSGEIIMVTSDMIRQMSGDYADREIEVPVGGGREVEPGVEATRVHAIKQTLLDAFSGPFSVRLPQALYDLAHGRG